MISVAVMMYSGMVKISSGIFDKAPRMKASEGVLALLARLLNDLARRRGIKSSVSFEFEWRK